MIFLYFSSFQTCTHHKTLAFFRTVGINPRLTHVDCRPARYNSSSQIEPNPLYFPASRLAGLYVRFPYQALLILSRTGIFLCFVARAASTEGDIFDGCPRPSNRPAGYQILCRAHSHYNYHDY